MYVALRLMLAPNQEPERSGSRTTNSVPTPTSLGVTNLPAARPAPGKVA